MMNILDGIVLITHVVAEAIFERTRQCPPSLRGPLWCDCQRGDHAPDRTHHLRFPHRLQDYGRQSLRQTISTNHT